MQGTFSVIGVGIPALTLDLNHTRAYSFTMTGASNTVSTTALTGALGLKTTAMTQAAFSGVKYSVSAGAVAVAFGNELTTTNLDSNLMSGAKYFYFSRAIQQSISASIPALRGGGPGSHHEQKQKAPSESFHILDIRMYFYCVIKNKSAV